MSQAANFEFPGGIEQIRIADADDFDTSANANFLVTVDRNSIASEGIDIPDPDKVTIELADDREVRNGIDQTMSLRFTAMPTADFDTLNTAVNDGTEVFVEVTSTATDGSGNPKVKAVYKRVFLNHAAHSPVDPDRDSYGVVLIDGKTTGYEESDILSLTKN